MRPEFTPNDVERFNKYVSNGDGCWEWQAVVLPNGYGQFSVKGRSILAHRASYLIHIGPIPDGLFVCHHCDNRSCVRPDHLFLGTHADNMRDRNNKGRQARGAKARQKNPATGRRNGKYTKPERTPRGERHGSRTKPESIKRGEDHPSAKITEDHVRMIRSAPPSVSSMVLAKQIGVTYSTVWKIRTRRAWNHID